MLIFLKPYTFIENWGDRIRESMEICKKNPGELKKKCLSPLNLLCLHAIEEKK